MQRFAVERGEGGGITLSQAESEEDCICKVCIMMPQKGTARGTHSHNREPLPQLQIQWGSMMTPDRHKKKDGEGKEMGERLDEENEKRGWRLGWCSIKRENWKKTTPKKYLGKPWIHLLIYSLIDPMQGLHNYDKISQVLQLLRKTVFRVLGPGAVLFLTHRLSCLTTKQRQRAS